jgi:hypothetical protein
MLSHDERLAAIKHAANEIEVMSEGLLPKALVILGSGLAGVVHGMDVWAEAPFDRMPGFAGPAWPTTPAGSSSARLAQHRSWR